MAVSLVQGTTDPFTASGTTFNIGLSATATSGNLLISWVAYDKDSGAVTGPTGWSTAIVEKADNDVTLALAWKESAGTEQNITWTCTTARTASARIAEYSGITTPVLDKSAKNNTGASAATSISTGTTATTTAATATAFALMGVDTVGNVTAGRAWTNSFTEQEFAGSNAAFSHALKELTSTGTQESTFSTTGAGDQMSAIMAVFKSNAGGGITINAATESISVSTFQASVLADVSISAGLESINVSTFASTVDVSASIDINASAESIDVLTFQASVQSATTISAATESISISTFPALVGVSSDILASLEGITLTANNATIDVDSDVVIAAALELVSVSTFQADIVGVSGVWSKQPDATTVWGQQSDSSTIWTIQ